MSKHRYQELETSDLAQAWASFPHLLNTLVYKERIYKRKIRTRAEEYFNKLLAWITREIWLLRVLWCLRAASQLEGQGSHHRGQGSTTLLAGSPLGLEIQGSPSCISGFDSLQALLLLC